MEEFMNNILGYDCDGEAIEEFRILRAPFSAEIDNWDEEPNIEPRFYCAIRGNNNQCYLISVYDDYNSEAIKRYEKIQKTEQISTKIKSIDEASNYEVAFSGITKNDWYYDRDRKVLKEKLETFIKRRKQKEIDEEER